MSVSSLSVSREMSFVEKDIRVAYRQCTTLPIDQLKQTISQIGKKVGEVELRAAAITDPEVLDDLESLKADFRCLTTRLSIVLRKQGIRIEAPKIDSVTTGNTWLVDTVLKDRAKGDKRDSDTLSFAALNTKCRKGKCWDLPKIFPTRSLSAADVANLSTGELIGLRSEDFFAIIDLISGKQAMAFIQNPATSEMRKMAFYFFSEKFAEEFAAAQKRLLDVPIDPAVKAEADAAWKKYQKTYPAEKLKALMEKPCYKQLDKERMGLSSTLQENPDEVVLWEKVNPAMLTTFGKKTFDTDLLGRLNSLFRIDAKAMMFGRELDDKDRRIGIRGAREEVSDAAQGRYYLPGCLVRKEMDAFTESLNKELEACDRGEKNPILVASAACQRFVSIHPCLDANGRTGRFLADLILSRNEMLPVAWKKEKVPVFPIEAGHEKVTPTMALQRLLEGLHRSYEIVS